MKSELKGSCVSLSSHLFQRFSLQPNSKYLVLNAQNPFHLEISSRNSFVKPQNENLFFSANRFFGVSSKSGISGKKIGTGFNFISKGRRKSLNKEIRDEFSKLDESYKKADPALGALTSPQYVQKMISLVKKNRVDEVLEDLRQKQQLGYKPEVSLLTSLMNGYRLRGDFPQVLELYKEVKQLPLEKPPSIAYNILINTFAKLKKFDEMEKIFQEMKDNRYLPTTGCYASILRAFAEEGNEEKVLHYWDDFKKCRILDKSVGLYNIVLKMYRNKDDRPKAIKWFKEMRKLHFRPNSETHHIMHEFIKDPY